VLLLEERFYEETVFTGNQQIGSQTFPELAIPAAHLAIAVHLVLSSGNFSPRLKDEG
jgi:hypothetical protein